MRASVYLSDQGKVTIPKAIREELDLEKGDVLEIDVSKANE